VPAQVDGDEHFRFLIVSGTKSIPMESRTRWLDAKVRADIVDEPVVHLGPEPLIGAQRIVLRLGEQRLELATDGLGPFAVVSDGAAP
jgi:general secretion pathway protein H